MRILAIETSCDDTSVAVVETSGRISTTGTPVVSVLSSVVSSQTDLHTQYGGIVPNLARREHERNLPFVLEKALTDAKCQNPNDKSVQRVSNVDKKHISKIHNILAREEGLADKLISLTQKLGAPNIDAIAVTQGPGLEPALWVGVNTARALSVLWKKPLVAVNHMEGHIAAILLSQDGASTKHKIRNTKQRSKSNTQTKVQFPAIALLVSGGHTQIILVTAWGKYRIIGETRDDAAGEAFDKVARMLDLPYPGGPQIAALAAQMPNAKMQTTNYAIRLPRPMMKTPDYDFSFSGLKTAVLYLIRDLKKADADMSALKSTIAHEFQNAVVDVLVSKTLRAAKAHKAKTVILGGGVAANDALRTTIAATLKKSASNTILFLPEKRLTTDNAAMIGAASIFKASQKKYISLSSLKARSDLRL